MDLEVKDVAELLNVSETTISEWLSDGKIPGYKINNQFRFSRIEIENWMMRCKLKPSDEGFSPLPQNNSRRKNMKKRGLLSETAGSSLVSIGRSIKVESIMTSKEVRKKFSSATRCITSQPH